MATIRLSVVVPNIGDVIETFNRIKVHRSITTVLGPYVEISTGSTRPALATGQIVYEFVDTAGADTYFYKSSYFHTGTGLESSLSDAQQGEGDYALSVISVDELKTNFLFGIDLTDDAGNAFPDSMYQFYIKSAVSWVEHHLDIPLRPLSVVDEKHDFYRLDYNRNMALQLLHKPVLAVSAVRLVLPINQTAMTYDVDSIQLDEPSGQLNIIPAGGQIVLGETALLMPFTTADFIPNVFRVDYTAGFTRGTIPADVIELVGKLAAMGPLNIAGDLVFGAGLAAQQVNLDGLMTLVKTTQSPTNSGYGARILMYNREIKGLLAFLRREFQGIRMIVG